MMLSREQLAKCFPIGSAIDQYVDPINKTCEKFSINTSQRQAMFLAQMGHESGDLKTLKENLNYSGDRLLVVFAKYFKGVDPAEYARNPQKIANRVYASRMGNGDEASGDGWKYHGRGAIQLTGKTNYQKFSETVGKSLDEVSAYLETPEGAIMSAGWFWNANGLNKYADSGDIKECSVRVNGGTNGLEDRIKRYEKYLSILS